jgi:hypothetical protein
MPLRLLLRTLSLLRMVVVRPPLLRTVNLKPRLNSSNNKASSRVSSRASNKACSKVNNQRDPASPCLVAAVVVDVEEAGPMYLQANVEPVALKRADMAMLVVEVEEDAVVAVVE